VVLKFRPIAFRQNAKSTAKNCFPTNYFIIKTYLIMDNFHLEGKYALPSEANWWVWRTSVSLQT